MTGILFAGQPALPGRDDPSRRFRCAIIGEGTLPLQCAERLLSRGHDIIALAAPRRDAARWSHQRDVPLAGDVAALASLLAGREVDYLFSIVNPTVLKSDVLAIPRLGAINYHDSPLPRYAGVNATTWALMHGETEHAISWHEIAERVDAGRILKRRAVPIAPTDTALSLNTKCYEAAIVAFEELIGELEQGTNVPCDQDLTHRSYFATHHRPPNASIIDWTQSADRVSAFVRALDFGPLRNPVATPKIMLGTTPFVAPHVRLLDEPSAVAPGTVVRATADELVVAAADRLVAIPTLATLDGEAVSLGALIQTGVITVGASVQAPSDGYGALDGRAARTESFWRTRLADVRPAPVPGITIGDGAPRDVTHGHERTSIPLAIPAEFARATSHDWTTSMLALFTTYLARVGDGEPFDVGVTTADRAGTNVDPTGIASALFATQRPLQVAPVLSSPFGAIVDDVAHRLDAMTKRGTWTRDLLSRVPELRRDELRHWMRGTPVGVDILGADGRQSPNASALTLVLDALAQTASLAFDSDALHLSSARAIAGHLETLAQSIVLTPNAPIAELALLTEREREQVLYDWNATEHTERAPELVHEQFSARAAEAPNDVALTIEGDDLTYGALEAKANQLAWELRARGVGPNIPVGLCLERSHELVIAMLGILKAGGAYVPLDPDHPADRLAFVVQDAAPKVIVTVESLRAVVPAGDVAVISLDDPGTRIFADRETSALPSVTSPEHLAYILYTSGSTGQPKGVMLPHSALGQVIRWTRESMHLGAGDVVMQKTPISFDPSGLEIYLALTSGARLVLMPPKMHQDLAAVLRTMHRERVTATIFVPSVLAASAELAEFADGFAALRFIICGGEMLTAELARRVYASAPNVKLYNVYGPTEAAIMTTTWLAPHNGATGGLPIGRPMENVRVYVLDERLQPLPIGVAGELCLGGIQVAQGYLNRPDLTAAKFVDDPFTKGTHPRLYRTGDLARWRHDGVLEFLGRADGQVKVRGFRIELGEIETVLAAQPSVRQCAVVRRGDAQQAQLVAYVVPTESTIDANALRDVLRDALRARLPQYMVPAAFVTIDALPMTANGKLDQRALPEPDFSVNEDRPYTTPVTTTEVMIADVWRELLGLARVGRDDNFFEIGGNSLLGTRVLARLHEQHGITLPLRTLFDASTVERFAAAVDVARPNDATARRASGPTVQGSTEGPLSFAQELLWMLDQMQPGLPAYNLPEVFHVRGTFDVDAFQRALDRLIARHPALRLTFGATADGARQHVVEGIAVAVPVIDLRQVDPSVRQVHARQTILDEIRRPFDLTRPPLLRALVLQLANDEWMIVLTHHHIASDGWSRSTLLGDLATLYAAERKQPGAPVSLGDAQFTYTDFAAWQRDRVAGDALQDVMAYWRTRLHGAADVLALPTDFPRPPARTFDGAVRTAMWSPSLLHDAKRFGQQRGATLFMTLFAAFQSVLSRYSGQDDFVVGTPVGGRSHSGADRLVGYFANMLPLRTDVAGDPTFAQLIDRVRETCLGAFDHQDVPFEAILRELQPGAQPSHAPLFQVMFALQNTDPAELSLDGATVTRVDADNGSSKYDLWLTATEEHNGLHASVEFRTDLFEAATIDRFLGHVETFLREALQAPDRPVSSIPLLTGEEVETIARWNATEVAFPTNECIHTLIAKQAASTPDAAAVVYENERLTYRELDAKANQLAHHLIALGVKPGELVGLCVERSLDLMVALIGVMKAGAAYVPLDPGYPADRLALMLSDSAVRVLVAHDRLVPLLPTFKGDIVRVDQDAAAIGARPTTAPDVEVSPESVAYVIYTSGSTGVPKGAVLPHRAVVNYLQWMQATYRLDATDAVLLKAPVSFDASVWELYLPLVAGARLVVARPDGHRDPLYLLGTIAAQKVTVVQFVPSLLAALIETPGFAIAFERVRLLIMGGEALPGDLASRVRALLPHVEMHNLYGPTEAAVYATAYEVPKNFAAGVVPIGAPISNAQIHILSAVGGQHAPIGVPGELYIGGRGVGLGYLNRAELSAERFVADRFRNVPNALMYRTGDLARWRPDGLLEFLGRVDDQVKIRGFRVELGEIEAALTKHPAVRECAVVRRTSARGDDRLVGYVVPEELASPPDAATLRAWLGETLPDYMIPSTFVTLERFPLGVTGKLDRRALPEPARDEEARPYVAPSTETEREVAAAWIDVLGRDRVSADSDFFEEGGHSLLGMRVMLRLGGVYQLQLPLRLLFETRTVTALAAAIDRERASAHAEMDVEQMLAALEHLSDEEALRLLETLPSGNQTS